MWAGFIGGIILLVFKGGGWFSAVNKDGDYIEEFKSSIEKKIEGLEQKFEGRFDKINEKFDKIDERFDKIYFHLVSNSTVSRTSPLSLTELGRQVSEEINGKNWAKRQAERLGAQVLDKTEHFEMHDIASAYVHKEYEPEKDEARDWRRCAYMNGIEVAAVMEVLVVELRDALIEQFLEDTDRMLRDELAARE